MWMAASTDVERRPVIVRPRSSPAKEKEVNSSNAAPATARSIDCRWLKWATPE
jgi:hypothetical protein